MTDVLPGPWLDPQVAAFAEGWEIATSGTPAERRKALAEHMTRRMARWSWPEDWRRHVEVRTSSVPSAHGRVEIDVYRPHHLPSPDPTALVYFFGGAWWLRGDQAPDVAHLCGSLAADAGIVVLDVHYSLAPEHPYPRALDDAEAVVRWVHQGGAGMPVLPGRVAVGGMSAGANLAAALCIRLRDESRIPVALQVLEVPLLDVTAKTDEYVDFYLQGHDRDDPLVSPVRAVDLAGLPPALILVAEFDDFASEGRAYGNALRRAGVSATTVVFDGQAHLTPSLWPVTPAARTWRRLVAAELRALADD